ncbi:hypothetical protein [Saliterribacillus persicus]|uniref:EamA-like transporter family protein n=1 Tax=Saliterribacillus persicus TaxID=930114 RepID=A0A368YA74_9BACI|nr:hypothetical protein [Saliterribacillus persicus]RCW77161.1 hypothetical protein DFR57_10128 [Saliterribacillus persicus]
MMWNLRIPVIIFLSGAVSGIYQVNPDLFILEGYWFRSLQFIFSIVTPYLIMEKTGVNKLDVHFSLGLLIILSGILIDILLV